MVTKTNSMIRLSIHSNLPFLKGSVSRDGLGLFWTLSPNEDRSRLLNLLGTSLLDHNESIWSSVTANTNWLNFVTGLLIKTVSSVVTVECYCCC